MPTYNRTRMCRECPFRANAPRGWLGPLTIDEIEDACYGPLVPGTGLRIGDVGDLICHVDVGKRLAAGEDDDEIEEAGQQCVGMMRYVNNCLKRAHRPEVAEFQDRLKAVEDQPVIEARKFREHHTR